MRSFVRSKPRISTQIIVVIDEDWLVVVREKDGLIVAIDKEGLIVAISFYARSTCCHFFRALLAVCDAGRSFAPLCYVHDYTAQRNVN